MSRGRWAIVLAVVVVLALAAAYAAGQVKAGDYAAGEAKTTAPEVVRAQRFELVDGTGEVRALLALFPDGHAGLMLVDDQGRVRVTLTLLADGSPSLWLKDERGFPIAGLAGPIGPSSPP